MNFTKFNDIVNSCSKKNIDRKIIDKNWANSVSIVMRLFELALEKKKDIRIVSGVLHERFFIDFKDMAKEMLKEKLSLKAIVLHPHYKVKKYSFADIIKNPNHSGELIVAPFPRDDSIDIRHPHFILIGNKSYRLELSHSKGGAIANFNDPIIGGFLYDVFEDLYNSYKRKVSTRSH